MKFFWSDKRRRDDMYDISLTNFEWQSLLHGATAVRNEGVQNGVQALLIGGVQLSFLSNLV